MKWYDNNSMHTEYINLIVSDKMRLESSNRKSSGKQNISNIRLALIPGSMAFQKERMDEWKSLWYINGQL